MELDPDKATTKAQITIFEQDNKIGVHVEFSPKLPPDFRQNRQSVPMSQQMAVRILDDLENSHKDALLPL